MKSATILRNVLAIALLCTSAACARHASDSQQGSDQATAAAPAESAVPILEKRIEIDTAAGKILVSLDATHAPKTVANFLQYVDRKFYNGGTFFRAVPGFVIQGGNHSRERPSDPKLELEPPSQTGLRNTDGVISMARTMDPNSATSEFFICDGDQATLDQPPGYAAFGHVISGMDVVRKIANMPASAQMLLKPVKIITVVRVPISNKS
jgi:peptidyl-prolyl cis-trans isomerase A (cyclophilin A)